MEVITIIYSSTLKFIAEKIKLHLNEKECILFDCNISIEKLEEVWINYESILKVSDLIIPILSPVQRKNDEYAETRIFYEFVGLVEETFGKMVLPVYLHLPESSDDNNEDLIRHPEQFFTDILSLNWNKYLEKNNLEKLDKKIIALKKLAGIEDKVLKSEDAYLEETISKIKNLISKDKVNEGLFLMKKMVKGHSDNIYFQNAIVMLENQLYSFKRTEILNTQSSDNSKVEKNKIISNSLKLLDEIVDEIQITLKTTIN